MEERRIVALGDIHGNFAAFREIVTGLGVVNSALRWTAHDTVFVQIGDICDRGTESRAIYELLAEWQEAAPVVNSEIRFLLGNHEVMEVFGYDRDAGVQEIKGYAEREDSNGFREHGEAFAPGGWLYQWLIRQWGMTQVGSIVFGHGDLPISFQNRTVEDIHGEIIGDLQRYAGKRVTGPESLPDSLFSEEQSLIWCRQSRDADHYGHALNNFLAANGASLYVCGHTPSIAGSFTSKNDGRYLCIDTAMGFEDRGIGRRSIMVVENRRIWEWSFRKGSIDRKRLPMQLDQ
jgi:hypothetical protein